MVATDVEATKPDRLRNFAALFADYAPDVAKFFAGMAAEEDPHKSQFEGLVREALRRSAEVSRSG